MMTQPNQRRLVTNAAWLALGLAGLLASACRGGGTDPFAAPGSGGGAAGPTTGVTVGGTLECPEPAGALPVTLEATGWNDPDRAAFQTDSGRANHLILDVIANPGDPQVIEGVATYNVGIEINGLDREWVSIYHRSADGTWTRLGRVQTETQTLNGEELDGAFRLELTPDQQLPVGEHEVYAIVEGDQTCAKGGVFIYPEGTEYIVSDLDGTMTTEDGEIILQIGDPNYVALHNEGAPEMMRAYDEKGYVIVYLTARPYHLRMLSRVWLDQLDFPFGMMRTADEFVFDEAARTYKREFINRLQNDLGFVNLAAYGNAESDIDAYADAGIPKEQTFIIGPNAGNQGTVPIPNQSFLGHTSEFVTSLPDAEQPF